MTVCMFVEGMTVCMYHSMSVCMYHGMSLCMVLNGMSVCMFSQ